MVRSFKSRERTPKRMASRSEQQMRMAPSGNTRTISSASRVSSMVLIAVLIGSSNTSYRRRERPEVSLQDGYDRGMHVFFTPIGRTAEGKADETLLDVARRAAVPLGNACGGIGICARCRGRIVEGAEKPTPPTALQTRGSAPRGADPDQPLGCHG